MKKQKAGKTTASKKNILLFLSILAVVAVSGCISLGDLFGSGTTTVEASPDVMSFSDSAVIPNPPILTGDTFTTSFSMKNLDEFEDAQNVKLELYDWGVCEPTSTCAPKDGVYTKDIGTVSPNDVQQIECQFRAPSSEKIGGIDARCPIRYKLTYDFSGITTTDLNVISNKKFQEMSRAGQTPTVTSVQSKSRGPIKVDFSFGVNQPVRTSNKTDNNIVKIPMYITVENKGSGKAILGSATFVSNNKKCTDSNKKDFDSGSCFGNGANTYFCNNGNIEMCGKNKPQYIKADPTICKKDTGCINAELNIKIPAALTYSGTTSACEEIKCDGFFTGSADGTDGCKLTLSKNIDFVKDKSQVFRCELTSPDEKVVTDTKTFSIQSEAKYTYQLDNDFSVAIRPMTFG